MVIFIMRFIVYTFWTKKRTAEFVNIKWLQDSEIALFLMEQNLYSEFIRMLNELKKQFCSYITHVMRWCIRNSALWCQTHGWNLNEYKLIVNVPSNSASDFFFSCSFWQFLISWNSPQLEKILSNECRAAANF